MHDGAAAVTPRARTGNRKSRGRALGVQSCCFSAAPRFSSGAGFPVPGAILQGGGLSDNRTAPGSICMAPGPMRSRRPDRPGYAVRRSPPPGYTGAATPGPGTARLPSGTSGPDPGTSHGQPPGASPAGARPAGTPGSSTARPSSASSSNPRPFRAPVVSPISCAVCRSAQNPSSGHLSRHSPTPGITACTGPGFTRKFLITPNGPPHRPVSGPGGVRS
jgi:hypothetical protein